MDFDFGRVIRRTFEPLKNNPLTFFGLALLLVGLPAALLGYIQQQAALDMVRGFETADPNDPAAVFGTVGTTLTWSFVGLVVSIITGALLQGSLIHAAVADYRGGKATIGQSLSTGIKHVLPIVAISILLGLGIGLGFIFLIVPGLFLLVKWIVAIPAQVAENTGIGGAFGRSWDLTKGAWWPLFGLLVLYAIAAYIVQIVLAIPLGVFGAASADDPYAAIAATGSPLGLLGAALIATVQGAIAASGVAAIYYELRQQKDGAGAEDLASVFA